MADDEKDGKKGKKDTQPADGQTHVTETKKYIKKDEHKSSPWFSLGLPSTWPGAVALIVLLVVFLGLFGPAINRAFKGSGSTTTESSDGRTRSEMRGDLPPDFRDGASPRATPRDEPPPRESRSSGLRCGSRVTDWAVTSSPQPLPGCTFDFDVTHGAVTFVATDGRKHTVSAWQTKPWPDRFLAKTMVSKGGPAAITATFRAN